MGMSSSQYSLGFLTSRSNTIGRNLMQLANDKRALTREMREVSEDYQDALNSKVLKWSNNAGATYSDLSYTNLMYPSDMNLNNPYLLTDRQGKVVVDSKYKKYAEMISPDGSANGDWESNRTKILAELTNIDASKIESMNSYAVDVEEKKIHLDSLVEPKPEDYKGLYQNTYAPALLEKIGTTTLNTNPYTAQTVNWADLYSKNGTIDLGLDKAGTIQTLETILSTFSSKLGPYFMDKKGDFEGACKAILTSYKGLIEAGSEYTGGAIQGKPNNYKLDVAIFIEELFRAAGIESIEGNGYSEQPKYTWYNIDDPSYGQYVNDHDKWEVEHKAAEDAYNAAVAADNQNLTAKEESLIAFYDTLFSSIAEKGWTYNDQVSDTEYLNQMLQNNLYTLTTVERTSEYDCENDEFNWFNDYSSDIASNFTNVFTVSDTDAVNQALAEYEYQKSIINEKETRIDIRMQDLQTEQAAIKQMIQGIESVRNDNIERNFSIMG